MTIQLAKKTTFNKIVVVGHPLSGYHEVENLLNTYGMNPAKPSRRDGFLPSEISAALSKAHKIPSVAALDSAMAIEQTHIGAVWHGMALDLLLGNIDHEFWGWADPQLVHFLDYWKDLDPQLAFVLVYDTPQQFLLQVSDEKTPQTAEALKQLAANWSTFNAALLHFYHRNSERCLLVNGEQVRESAAAYLQQVQTRIGAPVANNALQARVEDADGIISRPSESVQQSMLKAYIANDLVQHMPDVTPLYEELQSMANLALARQTAHAAAPLDAWIALRDLESREEALAVQVESLQEKNRALSDCLDNSEATVRELQQRVDEQRQRIAEVEGAKISVEADLQALQRECKLAVLQLHQTQDDLGRQQARLNKSLQIEAFSVAQQAEIDSLRQQLAAQAGMQQKEVATPRRSDSALESENRLLLLQLHKLQEELNARFLKERSAKPAPPKERVIKPEYYGAAERVKQQLSYRLGATLIARSRSLGGWISMPWALVRQVSEYKAQCRSRSGKSLPAISAYRDAREAEKVKLHLSYRLGYAMLANARSPLGWIKMPWMLRREVKAFRHDRS